MVIYPVDFARKCGLKVVFLGDFMLYHDFTVLFAAAIFQLTVLTKDTSLRAFDETLPYDLRYQVKHSTTAPLRSTPAVCKRKISKAAS